MPENPVERGGMDNVESKAREEEYVRRMRERGYQDSLRGMDDEDIEWARSRPAIGIGILRSPGIIIS